MICLKALLKKWLPEFLTNSIRKIKSFFLKIIYLYEINKRSKYSIFDYYNLSKDMNLVSNEYGYNSFYGLADIIKECIGQDKKKVLDAAVEHGLCISRYISPIDTRKDCIYTLSEDRKIFLEGIFPNKKIYAMGPYIQYVKSYFCDSKIKEIKEKLGKTLLIFHVHSTHHVDYDYDVQKFMEHIESIKNEHNFNTIMVCMYWKDILRGNHYEFEKKGYTICTAGHLYDPNFLLRLKSIILLADMTMSNSLGTHIGYCVCLNKPHYYFKQKLDRMDKEEDHEKSDVDSLGYYLLDKCKKCFGTYKEFLTKEDIKFVEEYWGKWEKNKLAD